MNLAPVVVEHAHADGARRPAQSAISSQFASNAT